MGVDQSKSLSKEKVIGANSSWNDNFQLFMTTAPKQSVKSVKKEKTEENNDDLN